MDDPPLADGQTAETQGAHPVWPAHDATRLYLFQVFNAFNFQIALGPPLVLIARHWGASNFYVGALTALVPLLTTLQIYIAPRVEHIGFRRVMLSGWGGRNVVLGVVCLLAFLSPRLSHQTLLVSLFVCMLFYNFIRGLATGAWMPWISALIPQSLRGRFLSHEQLYINLSSAAAFLLSGKMLGHEPGAFHFGTLYLLAFLCGWVSLYFLKSVQSPPPREGKPETEPISHWVARVWRDRPFRRLIRMNIFWSLTYAAWTTFVVVFLRDELQVPEGNILYINAASTLGSVASVTLWGKLADRFGSRPVMSLSTRLIGLVVTCWLLTSVGLFPGDVWSAALLFVLMGMSAIGFVVANNRYCLNNAPRAFPVLALTLFSVVTSLINGLAPIVWGWLLDMLSAVRFQLGYAFVGPFTWFFFLTLIVLIVTKLLVRRLPDTPAHPTHVMLYYMINDYPLRTLNAFYKALFQRSRGSRQN